jgi:lysophospholipase L1-like esterase
MKSLLLCLSLLIAGHGFADPLRLGIVGDSTVCNYPENSACRGWGQFIEGYFQKGSVTVSNFAKSGRSTKTFLKEGLWKRTLDYKPDIVLIQFGHNDSHGHGKPEATDAATDYKDYLRRFIDGLRAIGAMPILVTPMHRRTFQGDKLTDILGPYADAMKAVGAEKKVPVIDLHASSGKLFEPLGDAGCVVFANAPTDRTHFNEKGARAMAELVMKELPQVEPRLKASLTK